MRDQTRTDACCTRLHKTLRDLCVKMTEHDLACSLSPDSPVSAQRFIATELCTSYMNNIANNTNNAIIQRHFIIWIHELTMNNISMAFIGNTLQ